MSRQSDALGAPPAAQDSPSRTGFRLFAGSLLLVALCVVQDAGLMVADTKLDLAVDPVWSLSRALTLWDPQGAFGQVGNQAYGYLWPMGPFYLLGDLLGAPAWLVQRLWQGLVLVVAFQGAARLARAMGTRSDTALLVTGFAFALSPRMLTTLGPISIEAWPSALAPWVLLALVRGSEAGSARRAGIAAGVLVGMVGGVNAVATFAVIPLGVVWLLTREPGPRRRTLMLWWPVATLLSCLWWLVPLFILGRYSPPFLDYIESSSVTTYPTTLFNALRGTSAWVPYVEPRWRAGWDLVSIPVTVLNSAVVMVLGLAGLSRRDNPHRVFLVSAVLLGLVMVTAGHSGPVQGWFAADVRALLDGALSPLRNVHKFDPLIRLPLVLGLGHLVSITMRDWHRWRAEQRTRPGLGAAASRLGPAWLAVVAVAGAALPVATGRLMPGQSFAGIPDYWQQTADWLADDGGGDQALLLPGSSFADYAWGNTQDEPLQPLARSPWAVRNAIPLTPGGTIRALDAVEDRLQGGQGSAALTSYLRRLGVRWLVVRNDLDRASDVVDPALVHQALATSPGLTFRTAFGPLVGGDARLEADGQEAVVAYGWQARYAAVEIFEVTDPAGPASAALDLPVVAGGPEDLLTLTEEGLLADQPVLLAADADPTSAPQGPVLLTDGLGRRDRVFGRLHNAVTPVLTDTEVAGLDPVRDYSLQGEDRAWRTRARVEGVRAVTASSSTALSRRVLSRSVSSGPYAAFDGDADSAWTSDPTASTTPRLRVELRRPEALSTIDLVVGPEPDTTSELRVRTENGTTEALFVEAGDHLSIDLPPGATGWVEVEESSGQSGRQLSLAEVDLPGVAIRRWLVTPRLPAAWGAPDYISLDHGVDARSGCVLIEASLRCSPARQALGEDSGVMRRLVAVSQYADYEMAIRALPRPGTAVADLLTQDALADVTASSSSVTSISAAGPLATVDGDPGTTWISSALDPNPELDVSWVRPRRVSSIGLDLDPEAPARRPTAVIVSYPGGSQQVALDSRGAAEIEPVRVDRLTILVDRSTEVRTIDFDQRIGNLGVGVSELLVNDEPLGPIGVSSETVDYGCGSGPQLRLNVDQVLRTSIVARPVDIHRGLPVEARLCDTQSVRLGAGVNRLRLKASEAFSPLSMVLTRVGSPGSIPVSHLPVSPQADGSIAEDGTAAALVLRHNVNAGWQALADGDRLAPMTVDGWQQGYALGTVAAEVRLRYAPQTTYAWGLVVGAATLFGAVLLLVGTRVRPGRVADAALGPSRRAGVVTAGAWLLGAGLMAGTAGVLVVLAVAALLWLTRARWALGSALALAPVLLVGGWYALRPWGDPLGWAGSSAATQWLMLAPLAALPVAALLGRPTLRKRDSGRSTNQ